ncbi:MAG: sulfite exporter TauE/SafE family protein [Patescibacteria group bacterium]
MKTKNNINSTNSLCKKDYYVQGMHCSTCEILIKQDITNLNGVEHTTVSLNKSSVTIHAQNMDSIPSHDLLNNLFKELGYTFYEQIPVKQKLNKQEVLKVVVIAMLFLGAFYLLEKSGLFMQYSITNTSSIWAYFVFGLAAGISSCAALVGGLLLSLSKKWNEVYKNNSKKSTTPFVYFNAARVITFALFGGILGYLGSFLQVSITLTAVLTLAISVVMFILGLQMLGFSWFNKFKFSIVVNSKYLDKNTDFKGKFMPMVVGALTFFIPCGFTLIAQTNALSAGSFYKGMMQLGAFSLGTLPILALISFSSVRFYANPKFSRYFNIFAGIIIVFFALYTINSQLNVLGITNISDIKISTSKTKSDSSINVAQEGDYQVIQMEATGFEYFPKEITIKSGVKTKLEIYDNGAIGCAKALYAQGLYPEVIYLKPGINTVTFVAPQAGNYKISCSMGMVPPVTVRVIK